MKGLWKVKTPEVGLVLCSINFRLCILVYEKTLIIIIMAIIIILAGFSLSPV